MARLKKTVQTALDVTAQSTSVNSTTYDGQPYDVVILYVNVSECAAGTLVVGLETSPDSGTTWYSLGNGQSLNTVSQQRQVYRDVGMLIRVAATVAGTTPDIDFSVMIETAKEGDCG